MRAQGGWLCFAGPVNFVKIRGWKRKREFRSILWYLGISSSDLIVPLYHLLWKAQCTVSSHSKQWQLTLFCKARYLVDHFSQLVPRSSPVLTEWGFLQNCPSRNIIIHYPAVSRRDVIPLCSSMERQLTSRSLWSHTKAKNTTKHDEVAPNPQTLKCLFLQTKSSLSRLG